MRCLQLFLTVALCLTLLATSVVQAVARGQMATGQMMQICAGGQTVTVLIDATGKPVDARHPCPDCLAMTAALPPLACAITHPLTRAQTLSLPAQDAPHAKTLLHPHARGPPGPDLTALSSDQPKG